ncbi:hypothetical protein EPN90_04140 [Patescibacteria group bacterium]|nr:MAG: hypothetical protein EPN90_04140 [Patescibacteria group bacterium]
MKSIKSAVIYGFLIWLIPFTVAFLIFPLRISDRPFFESIMPVAVTATTVIFTVLYFKKVEANFLKEGALLGAVFLAISITIDLLMFSRGPMAMPLLNYVKDIGFTYLLIPAITIGTGYILDLKKR